MFLYRMKYIRRKPVRDLVKDDFLKLQMAEDDKLLTISFDEEVDGLGSLPYIEEVKQLYIRVSFMHYNHLILITTTKQVSTVTAWMGMYILACEDLIP